MGSVQNDNDIINTVESDSLSGNPYSEQTAEPIRIMESAKPRKAGFVTRLRNGLADMLRRGADDLHERARKNRITSSLANRMSNFRNCLLYMGARGARGHVFTRV